MESIDKETKIPGIVVTVHMKFIDKETKIPGIVVSTVTVMQVIKDYKNS